MDTQSVTRYAIIGIPILLLLIFLIYPVSSVLVRGLVTGPGSSFLEVWASSVTHRVFGFTVTQALVSTIVTVLLGLPAGIILAKLEFRGKGFVQAAMLIPFVLPPIVVVVGFLRMFGQGGFIDSILMTVFMADSSILNLASCFTGIVLAHVFYNIPLVALIVSSSLERLSPEIEESADILGAGSIQKFKRIIMPHIMQSIVAASLLTFLFCFMSFPIVLALGQGRYATMEVRIWNAFRLADYGEASSLALIQLVITMILAYWYVSIGRSGGDATGQTRAVKTVSFQNLSRNTQILAVLYTTFVSVLIVGPVVSVFGAAFYSPITEEFTIRGFTNLVQLGTGKGLQPLLNSLFYATLSTFFAVLIAIPLAYRQRFDHSRVATITSAMTFLPLGISSITLAYGLMRAVAVPLGLSTNPWPLIVIAQTIIGLPFTVRSIEIAVKDIDRSLLEQADLLGASRLERLFFLELPLIAPGILVGATFSFAMAIGEMSATLFIALPQNTTLAVAIYQYLGVRKFVEAGAAALVLTLCCSAAFLSIERLSDRTAGGAL
ncbi:MAG: ABC transporter permease [Promethearchaeia archaeon]